LIDKSIKGFPLKINPGSAQASASLLTEGCFLKLTRCIEYTVSGAGWPETL
jgi:hypothetical protein